MFAYGLNLMRETIPFTASAFLVRWLPGQEAVDGGRTALTEDGESNLTHRWESPCW